MGRFRTYSTPRSAVARTGAAASTPFSTARRCTPTATDTTELLGCFEQSDPSRVRLDALRDAAELVAAVTQALLLADILKLPFVPLCQVLPVR